MSNFKFKPGKMVSVTITHYANDYVEKLEAVVEAARKLKEYLGDGDNGAPQWIASYFEELDEAFKKLNGEQEGRGE
jgi:hypothetical protein